MPPAYVETAGKKCEWTTWKNVGAKVESRPPEEIKLLPGILKPGAQAPGFFCKKIGIAQLAAASPSSAILVGFTDEDLLHGKGAR